MDDSINTFNLQILITEQCNLRCSYCFETDKNSKKMSVELANEIIDKELSKDSEFSEYQIDLSGGEPFLDFEQVKAIVEYGIENAPRWKKKFYFFIGSNLTLINKEIEDWLRARRCWVVVGASLDGTKESHDRCRSNSYDDVIKRMPLYQELYPQQGVKMTIVAENIGSLCENIKHAESLGLAPSANVVYEPVWGQGEEKKELLRTFARQLDMLVQYYADNPNKEIPNLLSLPIHLCIAEKDPDHKWCGSGRTMRAYDTEGRALPCHRFSKFCTGKIYDPAAISEKVPTKCDDCGFEAACPCCAGYNWEVNGHPDSRTSYHCEFIKLQFLAAAKLIVLRNQSLIARLASGDNTNISEEETKTLQDLKAADFIMQNLDPEEIINQSE